MSLEQFANLAEIVGVIAILVTLIYLSVQVRQGNNLLRSEARQAQIDNDQNNIQQFVDHPGLASAFSSEETPSFEEKVRLQFWIIGAMRAREHEWLQYREGHLDETTWRSYSGVIYFILGTERARSMWDINLRYFNPDFVEMVAGMMDGAPYYDGWEKLREVS